MSKVLHLPLNLHFEAIPLQPLAPVTRSRLAFAPQKHEVFPTPTLTPLSDQPLVASLGTLLKSKKERQKQRKKDRKKERRKQGKKKEREKD